jgi:hypothetical protein
LSAATQTLKVEFKVDGVFVYPDELKVGDVVYRHGNIVVIIAVDVEEELHCTVFCAGSRNKHTWYTHVRSQWKLLSRLPLEFFRFGSRREGGYA